MGLLDWCEEFDRQAHIAGDTERQQLFHYFQRHLQFRQHDTETALQIVTDGQQHALRLREPWWALFYELQRIHLLGMLYRYTEAMEATVRAVVEARKPELICVDLREVTMLDSAGLGRLVSAHRRARRGGWRFVLVRGGRVVARVLQTTRLDEHLEVTRELPAAVRDTV